MSICHRLEIGNELFSISTLHFDLFNYNYYKFVNRGLPGNLITYTYYKIKIFNIIHNIYFSFKCFNIQFIIYY